jgi:hypothetical protein
MEVAESSSSSVASIDVNFSIESGSIVAHAWSRGSSSRIHLLPHKCIFERESKTLEKGRRKRKKKRICYPD